MAALPVKGFVYPIRFSTANPTIRVLVNTTEETRTLSVNTDEDYWLSADGSTTTGQRDLWERLRACLRTHSLGGTFDVSCSARNFGTISHPTQSFSIKGTHAGTTADLSIFGLVNGVDTTFGASFTAPNQSKGFWTPDIPHYRDNEDPVILGGTEEAAGGGSWSAILDTDKFERLIEYLNLTRDRIKTANALSTEPFGALEYAWVTGKMAGVDFRVYDDRTARTTTSYKKYRSQAPTRPWSALDTKLLRYGVDLNLVRVA